jgi:hypothetical protein
LGNLFPCVQIAAQFDVNSTNIGSLQIFLFHTQSNAFDAERYAWDFRPREMSLPVETMSVRMLFYLVGMRPDVASSPIFGDHSNIGDQLTGALWYGERDAVARAR